MVKIASDLQPPKPKYLIRSRLQFIDTAVIPFLVFWVSGTLSVLVDADHFEKILFDGLPIVRENFTGRGLHIPIFIVVGIILLYSLTHVYRLHALVLEEYMEKNENY